MCILLPTFFSANRARLLASFQEVEFGLFFSALPKQRTGDQYYPYRQDSNFYYLSGLDLPYSVVLLAPTSADPKLREVLFIKEPDEKEVIYQDAALTFEEASNQSGITTILPLSLLPEILLNEFLKADRYYCYPFQEDALSSRKFLTDGLDIFFSTKERVDIEPALVALRLKKGEWEIVQMKKACDYTTEVFLEMYTKVRPGVSELLLDADIRYGFQKRGIRTLAFEPIVASGENALILHYQSKGAICSANELVLFDFGCELGNYCSDCSRTLPVSARFSERQRRCYEETLLVYQALIPFFVKGMTIRKLNRLARLKMAEALTHLGLIKDISHKEEEQIFAEVFSYLPHGVSHFVGLDTHDVGSIDIPFEEGMVLTCEPGIYIKEERIGIRIETMLLITEGQPYDFFSKLPIEVKDIEDAMREQFS